MCMYIHTHPNTWKHTYQLEEGRGTAAKNENNCQDKDKRCRNKRAYIHTCNVIYIYIHTYICIYIYTYSQHTLPYK